MGTSPGWRPPQWAVNAPPLTIVGPDLTGAPGAPPVVYAFDNAGRADHQQELILTENPVQTGAAIVDHAYLRPSQLTVEIWMSDCMQSYISGQFSGAPSRSVSAFQTIIALQQTAQLVQVATRLRLYNNMEIVNVSASDTSDTRYGLRCSITFREVILANESTFTPGAVVSSSDQSSRAQTIASTQSGQSMPGPVPQAVDAQHNVYYPTIAEPGLTIPPLVDPTGILSPGLTVPNSGNYSSTNVNTLEYLQGPQ